MSMSGNRIDERLFDSREESAMTPKVHGKILIYQQDGQEQVLIVETAAWFAWLETASTFSFVSKTGSFTARREQAGHKRGGWYWKAYRKQHGKLSSHYLGKSETITLVRLQAVAQALADALVETVPDNDVDETRLPAQATAPDRRSDALAPLLSTKLHRPLPRTHLVRRPHLAERLMQGVVGPLTLVSAPAGFGKTTLLTQWLAESGMPSAWLSLDPEDNELVRFLSYVIAALQTLDPHLGVVAFDLLQMPRQAAAEMVLTLLMNDVGSLGRDRGDFVLVLDDYHVIDTQPIDQALTFLVEHLPPQMHLIIATREDPPLPLARLRARSHLIELRAADLRFTPSEAAGFLTQGMGLTLSAEDIARLATRTEGWIAGLQLAALSIQGHQDVSGFIRTFAGDHRYVVDYLVAEVLQRQPVPVRSFLLQTSILDRLTGPLCDAVTGQEEGNAQLEALERGNFFVVPLDDTRHWYRYHHLFAEMLYVHLLAEQPDHVAMLHRRASMWYEQHGDVSDAIRHVLAAEDFGRAADLIELAVPAMRRSRQDAMLLGWFKALPDEIVHFRPVLSVGYAYALLSAGKMEAVEARLSDAERWLDTTADTNELAPAPSAESFDDVQEKLRRRMVVVDEEEFRRLPGAIAIYRAARAQSLGDVANTMKYARRVLGLVPEDDHLLRGPAMALLGLASWASGDLGTAHRAFADGMASVQMAGNISDAISGTIALADIRIAQGRLREAMHTYEHALQEAMTQGKSVLRGTADLYVGMSELHREQNDLDAATQHLLRSKEMGERTGFPQNRSRWCVALARIREAEGDLDGTLDLLHEAERLYMRDFFPNVRPVAARVARVWVAQGRLVEALGWAREQSLDISDDLSYLREFEHITLARVLLARSQGERADRPMLEAMKLLGRLLKAAEEGGRMGSVIEILVQQALANLLQGDIPAALMPLQQALTLAEPEGYVRLFVDEGPPMTVLLTKLHERSRKRPRATSTNVPLAYIERLLALLRGERVQEDLSPAATSSTSTSPAQPLHDPLTMRELEVLCLIVAGLSNRAIAARLVLAVSTVKSYVNTIYSKLQVESRTQAVARARALHLLSDSSDPSA